MYPARGDDHCQVRRALDVVGEKWSLLIVRDALRGMTKFSEFRSSLGAPSDVLTTRLNRLVDQGILVRLPYREPGARERHEYRLTPAGEGLRLVIAALIQWGDEFAPAPAGKASLVVDAESREPVALRFVGDEGTVVDHATIVPGPAASARWANLAQTAHA